jgi:hypothetical protein
MPPRAQYQLHRYAARPSSLAPADKSSRSAIDKKKIDINRRKAEARPVLVNAAFVAKLRAMARDWNSQATHLERAPGAKLITDAAARAARVKTLRRVADRLRDLLNEI